MITGVNRGNRNHDDDGDDAQVDVSRGVRHECHVNEERERERVRVLKYQLLEKKKTN